MAARDPQAAVPQGPRREGVGALAGHLEIDARIGLLEALVGGLADEADFAVRADLGRGDQRILEHVGQLVVEIVDDRAGQDSVKREAADQQQDPDPQRRDADHPPGQRPDPRTLSPGRRSLPGRRRHRGGFIIQAPGSSRL